MARLIGLRVSPWSEKARWALAHHKIAYRFVDYVPMLGVPQLRVLTRRFRGKVTVPVFVDGDEVFADSLTIARHADEHGSGSPLFPSHQVEEWNLESETALNAGRSLTVPRLYADPDARAEQVPPVFPEAMRAILAPTAALGLKYVSRKYDVGQQAVERDQATLRRVLTSTRDHLRGKDYLLGDFSYADITMAAVLQFVRPVADRFVPMGPATRAAFTLDDIAAEFADLLTWRDSLYVTHRHALS